MQNSFLQTLVLNDVQRDAVCYTGGPQLVFAGAGTGKTRVLTSKIAYLIESCNVGPSQIFAATFTNKAARQMRERIESLLNRPAAGLWVGTFHSLCLRILRLEAAHLGLERSFSIYDADDQKKVLKKVLLAQGIDEKTLTPNAASYVISGWKNNLIDEQKALQVAKGYHEQTLAQVYREYQRELKKANALDFDDLIFSVVKAFQQHTHLRLQYGQRFTHILVDEYQDTNFAQFQLLKLLAQQHQNIFAVGDDDQSIYGWRGARIENILSFEKHFARTRVFKLQQNYRSCAPILEFANTIIAENKVRAEKKLWTARTGGQQVQLYAYRDNRHEAEDIAEQIMQLAKNSVSYNDVLVLFRTNAQSRSFEEAFRRVNIPYRIVGGLSFYQRKEIKDILAYLRLFVNPADDVSTLRVVNTPGRGIGAKSLEDIARAAQQASSALLPFMLSAPKSALPTRAAKGIDAFCSLYRSISAQQSVAQLVTNVFEQSGYRKMLQTDEDISAESRLENIDEFIGAVAAWESENPGGGLSGFLDEISLVSDLDKVDEAGSAVNCMTLHMAKGLEAPHVFVVGLEEGILPAHQNSTDAAKLEEERRLFYVGSTRAMQHLRVSYVSQRWRYGNCLRMSPSQFLATIPPSLYQFVDRSNIRSIMQPEPDLDLQPQPFEEAPKPVRKHTPAGRPGHSSAATLRRGSDFLSRQSPRPGARPTPAASTARSSGADGTGATAYRPGQQVLHEKYGRGKIVNVSGFGDDMRMTVLFSGGNRKRMMARFANLQIV